MGRLTCSLRDDRPKEHAYDMIARQQPDTTFHHARRPQHETHAANNCQLLLQHSYAMGHDWIATSIDVAAGVSHRCES